MNKTPYFQVVSLTALVFLGGCAQRWQKPGASDKDYQEMRASCEKWALERFPPSLREVAVDEGRITPIVTNCSGSGASLKCYTSGGRYISPTYMPVDDHQSLRDDETRACLIENGWSLVE